MICGATWVWVLWSLVCVLVGAAIASGFVDWLVGRLIGGRFGWFAP